MADGGGLAAVTVAGAGSLPSPRASHRAPIPAIAEQPAPMASAPPSPKISMRTSPAASVPAMAPSVFAAYSRPNARLSALVRAR